MILNGVYSLADLWASKPPAEVTRRQAKIDRRKAQAAPLLPPALLAETPPGRTQPLSEPIPARNANPAGNRQARRARAAKTKRAARKFNRFVERAMQGRPAMRGRKIFLLQREGDTITRIECKVSRQGQVSIKQEAARAG